MIAKNGRHSSSCFWKEEHFKHASLLAALRKRNVELDLVSHSLGQQPGNVISKHWLRGPCCAGLCTRKKQ